MAVIEAVSLRNDNGTYEKIMSWGPLTEADSGGAIEIPRFTDKTIQAYGTFDAAGAVTVYGSNNILDKAKEPSDATSSWVPVTDVDGLGNVVLVAAKKGATILENYTYMACEVTAGTGVSLTVTIQGQRRV